MTVKLDFEECLKDSPRFRASIELVEGEVSDLEIRLEKLLKLGSGLVESGRHYCNAGRAFVGGVRELGRLGPPEPMLSECLDKFTGSLSQMIDSHLELLENTQQALKQQIHNLVKEEVRRFREARREFERASEGLDTAVTHHAEVPRRRPHEADEAAVALRSARHTFRQRALDYVLQINVIQDKRKFDVLEFMLNLLEHQATHYQQGHEGLGQLQEYRRDLASQLHQMVLESAREKRDLEQRHVLLKQKDMGEEEPEAGLREGPAGPIMEGHLFKRASNAFKTWSRRWFSIQRNQLVYQKKYKDPVTVVVEDLRLCTVKLCPESERRFCFEVVSPNKSLGVHFSKVRSLTLDSWEPELVKLMCELGNAAINRIYEARVEDMTVKKPGPTCSRQEKEAWIRAKYVEKKFLTKLPEVEGRWRSAGRGGERTSGRPPRGRPPPPPKPLLPPRPGSRVLRTGSAQEELSSLHPGALLFQAAGAPPSLPTMADALAHGADVNWVNAAQANATPLIQATEANSLLACEFLLQNGANVNQTDSAGRGPLHHATIRGFTGLACLFLKRGAGLGVQDADGKDPLTIAMEAANADIVTLLRLAKMREADVALGQAGDETYLDIFRDFSLMASDDPDKLSRRSQDLNTL
ncbi:arf-GAP with coiled-coil, ANK repeat and PH domain-containing protein 1 isoform X2 [Ornithorhynchus anatinus]|uniref:arf-GAP with coiled-coil, ANK repeat and PH domain-containing protein 1 isoform X2 n=1 Tax=Ornithorhynchus anatinus TaxID=9258 RepID=UPI0010A7775F|nr:arf-GAP with coiled-coil, ANK repeat and PH domain-containing protein 1 isoform X2 [Ornithorhynchus anatinus]